MQQDGRPRYLCSLKSPAVQGFAGVLMNLHIMYSYTMNEDSQP
jgi:hypothetical protein